MSEEEECDGVALNCEKRRHGSHVLDLSLDLPLCCCPCLFSPSPPCTKTRQVRWHAWVRVPGKVPEAWRCTTSQQTLFERRGAQGQKVSPHQLKPPSPFSSPLSLIVLGSHHSNLHPSSSGTAVEHPPWAYCSLCASLQKERTC